MKLLRLLVLGLFATPLLGAQTSTIGELNDFAEEAIDWYHGDGAAFNGSGIEVQYGPTEGHGAYAVPGLINVSPDLEGVLSADVLAQYIAHEWIHHRDAHVDIDSTEDWVNAVRSCIEWEVYCEMLEKVLAARDLEICTNPAIFVGELCPKCDVIRFNRVSIRKHANACYGTTWNESEAIASCPNAAAIKAIGDDCP